MLFLFFVYLLLHHLSIVVCQVAASVALAPSTTRVYPAVKLEHIDAQIYIAANWEHSICPQSSDSAKRRSSRIKTVWQTASDLRKLVDRGGNLRRLSKMHPEEQRTQAVKVPIKFMPIIKPSASSSASSASGARHWEFGGLTWTRITMWSLPLVNHWMLTSISPNQA